MERLEAAYHLPDDLLEPHRPVRAAVGRRRTIVTQYDVSAGTQLPFEAAPVAADSRRLHDLPTVHFEPVAVEHHRLARQATYPLNVFTPATSRGPDQHDVELLRPASPVRPHVHHDTRTVDYRGRHAFAADDYATRLDEAKQRPEQAYGHRLSAHLAGRLSLT